jgi:hypothetical protein
MLASFWFSFWAFLLYAVLFVVLVLGTFALLGRIAGGRYLRPVVAGMAKVPLLRRGLAKLSDAAMRKQNPELASAIAKMQRAGVMTDPMKAQQAMSRLNAGERRAFMQAQTQAQETMDEPLNREQRRRLEKAKRDAQRRGGR